MRSSLWKILFVLPMLAPALVEATEARWTLSAEGLGAYASNWSGRTPPAALIRFKGQSLDSRAYALGCGHCNGMPVGGYIADQPVAKTIYLNDESGRPRGIPVTKIVFGTQTVVDLVLLELGLSYREIEQKFNIRARELAWNTQRVGTQIGFYNLEQIQYCEINEIRDRYVFNEEGTDYLLNPYIYYGCVSLAGHSGSILVAKDTNEVIGLNVGGTYPELRDGHVINYGSEVARLYSCLDAGAQFNVHIPACKLRIGEP